MTAKITRIFAIVSTGIILTCGASHAAKWDDAGVVPVQSISDHKWRDANTGQYISVSGMTDEAFAEKIMGVPPTPAAAAEKVAGAAKEGVDDAVKKSAGKTTEETVDKLSEDATKKTAAGWKGMGKAGKVATVAAGAVGAYGVYDSVSGQGEHGIGDLVEGALGGATLGGAVGTAVPVIGTAIGAGVGAGVGLLAAGSQLFSETDCLYDPITKKFTCCNTAFNQGERQVPIGGFMFCGDEKGETPMAPLVRQCLQGGSAQPASWIQGLFQDDAWAPECTIGLCPGEVERTEYVNGQWIPDVDKICYRWKPAPGSGGANTPGGNSSAGVTDADRYNSAIAGIEHEIQALRVQCAETLSK